MSNSVLAFQPKEPDFDPVSLYLNGLTASGRQSMRSSINQAARFFGYRDAVSVPWESLRYSQFVRLKNHLLARELAPKTINCTLGAVVGVVRQCYNEGVMPAGDYFRLKNMERVKGESEPPGRALEEHEIERLFEICAQDVHPLAGARDSAIFVILFGCGLRCFEVAGLGRGDYNLETGELRVRGKGRRFRKAYMPEEGRELMATWLALRGDADGPLFLALTKWFSFFTDRRGLTKQGIYIVVKNRGREAKLPHFSTHDCRRTFISDLLDVADLGAVQGLAGHKDPKTTMRYDRKGERRNRAAAQLVRLPCKPRAEE